MALSADSISPIRATPDVSEKKAPGPAVEGAKIRGAEGRRKGFTEGAGLKTLSLLDSSRIGAVVTDGERILDANETFLSLFGYARPDLKGEGLHWKGLSAVERPFALDAARRPRVRSDRSEAVTIQGRRKDGLPLSVRVSPCIVAKDPDRWICTIENLGQGTAAAGSADQAANAFPVENRSPAILGPLFDRCDIAAALLDSRACLRWANDRFAGALSLDQDMLWGRSVSDLMGSREFSDALDSLVRAEARAEETEGARKEMQFRGSISFRDSGHWDWRLVATSGIEGVEKGYLLVMLDASLRRKDERRLASIVQRGNLIMDAASEGVLGLDADGRHIFLNPSAERMLGWPREELLGRAGHLLWHRPPKGEELPEGEDCPILKACREGSVCGPLRDRFWRKDGSSFPVEFRARPLLAEGRPRGAIVTFMDITERARAEDLLLARLSLSNAYDGKSLDELITAALDFAESLTGSRIGFFHFLDADEKSLILQAWSTNTLNNMCKAEGKGDHYPVSRAGVWVDCVRSKRPVIHNDYEGLRHKKGLPPGHAPIIRELTVPVLRDGRVVAIMGVGNKPTDYDEGDIGILEEMLSHVLALIERKRAEESLRIKDLAIHSATSAIAMADLKGRLFYVNPAFRALWGRGEDWDATGSGFSDLWGSGEDSGAMLSSLVEKGEWSGEIRSVGAAGDPLDVRAFASLVRDAAGLPVCLQVWFEDVTDRKKAEEDRIARIAAEEANKAKSQFLATMSHEIRTPMNTVLGMSYLALQGELQQKERNYIEKVHRSAEHLLGIVNEILDFSKIEAGKLSTEKVNFSLDKVLDNLADLVGHKAEEKGLELMFATGPEVPDNMVGDPLRLSQVLLNLGYNAVKFTEHGEIVIGVDLASREAESVRLRFWVRDSGIGMTPEQCERVFQPFAQAENSWTRKYGGTGLGLVISARLVELMGGRLEVESQAGSGSTFRFTASFDLQEAQAQPKSRLAESLKGSRVLIVDDNETVRELYSAMLSGFGFLVETAPGGEEALEAEASAVEGDRAFDAILMDYRMPGMDGLECSAAIRERRGASSPPIVLVTAFDREGILEEAGRRGLRLGGMLSKPVTPSALLEALTKALGNSQREDRIAGAAERAALVEEAIRSLSGARLLVVEDNPMNQELATDLLRAIGVTAVIANDGRQALAALDEDGDFDGILMDCHMPVMDGYEATRRIRSRPGGEDIPILAMTANAMIGDREKAIQAGMNDQITKPIDVNLMYATLARWLRRESKGRATQRREEAPAPEVNVEAPDESRPVDPARALLDRLAIQLEGLDAEAGDTAREAMTLLKGGSFDQDMRKVLAAVERYEYDTAESYLQRLRISG